MKPRNRTPGTLASAEGNQVTTNCNVVPNTPESLPRLAPTGRETRPSFGKPRIRLIPLRFNGQNWGWLARTDNPSCVGCWGFTKYQARDRLLAVLRHK